jgi:hypothetical protein
MGGDGGREGEEGKEREGGREREERRGRENRINLGPPNVWGKFTPMYMACTAYIADVANNWI